MKKPTTRLFAACLIASAAMLSGCTVGPAGDLTVGRLRCEYRKNPLGIDAVKPRLFWKIEAQGERGIRQAAYQVLVASKEELLKRDKADLWDSRKVPSDQSIQVEYAGKPRL